MVYVFCTSSRHSTKFYLIFCTAYNKSTCLYIFRIDVDLAIENYYLNQIAKDNFIS